MRSNNRHWSAAEGRSVQVDRDSLSGVRRLLRDLEGGFSAMGEEESLNVEEFCALNKGSNFGRREVGLLEKLCCT